MIRWISPFQVFHVWVLAWELVKPVTEVVGTMQAKEWICSETIECVSKPSVTLL